MLRYIIILIVTASSLIVNAQDSNQRINRHFNPQRFENQLEQFILKKISLSPSESNSFIPIFREMRKEVLIIMEEGRKTRHGRPTNEDEWTIALKTFDANEIKLKKIQQAYHNKMLKVIPASKIMLMIRAEEEFHRESFRKMQMRMANNRSQSMKN